MLLDRETYREHSYFHTPSLERKKRADKSTLLQAEQETSRGDLKPELGPAEGHK
jgi:hypothetical protein